MALSCGIVGLPNVGKSTLFNAITASAVAAENYPFCTIEPNQGIVEVPDPRLDAIAALVKPQKLLRATVTFTDIAGLVAGAASGEGLGNQFLSHIRECDAVLHVARCFDDANIVHVAGKIDPVSDLEVIATELALADLASAEKSLLKASKAAKSGDKAQAEIAAVLERCVSALKQGKPVASLNLTPEQSALIRSQGFITAKPALIAANMDEAGIRAPESVPAFVRLKAHADQRGIPVVPLCVKLEAEIAQLPESDRAAFLADLGIAEPALNQVIRSVFALLGLQCFFTAGEKEVRAWVIKQGALAPQAAGAIHTDFERGFIRAQTIAYEDFIAHKGEAGARSAGKLRAEGKDYLVRDGDVMEFLFNV